jgi:hypothetical protein
MFHLLSRLALRFPKEPRLMLDLSIKRAARAMVIQRFIDTDIWINSYKLGPFRDSYPN